MNSIQAKELNLIDFVSKICTIVSLSNGGSQALFLNNLRGEKKPSLSVGLDKRGVWGWIDFSSGSSGNIINFVMIHYNKNSVSAALEKIAEIMLLPKKDNTTNNSLIYVDNYNNNIIEIKTIKPLQNKALIEYLESRNLNISLIKEYVEEIYYSINEKDTIKNFFAVAFKNNSDGYAIRNKYHKSNLIISDITYIALNNKPTKQVIIFEGFINFLSALTYYETNVTKSDVIILNSVSMFKKAAKFILENNYEIIYDFLDNDFAGQLCIIQIKEIFEEAFKNKNIDRLPIVKDSFSIYKGYNDFNDFLKSKQ